ncbi:MAG: glycosyltransferase family 2 protein [bacterium]
MNYKEIQNKNDSKFLSLVIPVFNEHQSIRKLYSEICQASKDNAVDFEVIFVDDGSTDGTFKVIEDINSKDKRIKALKFRKNNGKATALAAGFVASKGDIIVTMDGDLQDDPAEIPSLLKKLNQGYDLVSGWKKKRKDPLSKRIPSLVYNKVTSILSGIPIHDFNCGLKIYRREVIEKLRLYGELHRFIPVLAKWEGFRIGEVRVHHRKREFGKTKYGFSRFFKGLFDFMTVIFLTKYMKRPLHFFGIIGLLTSFSGAGIIIYLVILKLKKISYLSNRPLLFIGVMLLIIGVQFISIGLIGEMITRTHSRDNNFSISKRLGV